MLKRTITAAVALALLVGAIIIGDPLFTILVGVMSIIGVYEMLGCIGMRKSLLFSLCMYAISISSIFLMREIETRSLYVAVFAGITICFLFLVLAMSVFSEGKLPVDKVCIAFLTCVFVIIGFVSILMLRSMPHGGEYIYLIVFVAPWVTDTFAYFAGRLFGRHKLIPSVSPKKTIEGSIGGIVFCVIGCVVYRIILGNYYDDLPELWIFAVLGFVISIVSQIGDLIFSLIKRRYNIKDYGFLFPGHGGVLDRFDSVLVTAPLVLVVCELLIKLNIM